MSSSDFDDLPRFDRAHLWHPYTSMRAPLPTIEVRSACGTRLQFADGRSAIDGMASWWCAIHGYRHAALDAAARTQLDAMSHVMFGGLTHAPAVELGRRLLRLVPPGLDRIFYSDSGSVAVEVAIKLALQYWQARRQPQRQRLLTARGGYHGDTFAAMSVCDPVTGMHRLFSGFLPRNVFAPRPSPRFDEDWQETEFRAIAELCERHQDELCAIVIEPIVQGAGGMHFYHPTYLRRLRELADRYDLPLIVDEIATGFGRTGRTFACEHAEIVPDILCVGKALTGGYLSLAATLTTGHIADTISADTPGTFMHGPTFMGNPLACAIACASLDVLASYDLAGTVGGIETKLLDGLAPCRGATSVTDVRVLGAIGVIEMKEAIPLAETQGFLLGRGVWLRPFGRLLYAMPPFIISDDELETLTTSMCAWVATR